MKNNIKNISIIGGSIAGLIIAIAIAKRSDEIKQKINLQIFESSSNINIKEDVGIQLSPNATYILNKLGILNKLIKYANIPNNIKIYNNINYKPVANIPLGNFAKKRYGAPYIVVNKKDFLKILLKEIKKYSKITLNFEYKLINLKKINKKYQFIFKNKNKNILNKSDLYIGADGMWSKTKKLLKLNLINPNKFSGIIAYRALIESDKLNKKYLTSISMWLGEKNHIVLYPINNNKQFNLVILSKEKNIPKYLTSIINVKQLKQHLNNWNYEIKQILNKITNIKILPLYTSFHKYQIAKENILLIGDAAHPMLPCKAQGAAMAIEDAIYFTNFLYPKSKKFYNWSNYNINDNLRNFESFRNTRIVRIQEESEKNIQIFHMKKITSYIRDLFLILSTKFLKNNLLSRLDWLYDKKYDNFK